MSDLPIPEGTRPLAVYRREGDHIKVILPGSQVMILRPGDTLRIEYRVTLDPEGEPLLRFEAIDG